MQASLKKQFRGLMFHRLALNYESQLPLSFVPGQRFRSPARYPMAVPKLPVSGPGMIAVKAR